MDIMDLLKGSPELLGGLKNLGLDDSKIGDLANGVGDQLGGSSGFDFTDLLTGLDADSFLGKLDVASLAEQAGIDASTVQSALGMLAPVIAQFTGAGEGGLLGGLVKGLFKK